MPSFRVIIYLGNSEDSQETVFDYFIFRIRKTGAPAAAKKERRSVNLMF